MRTANYGLEHVICVNLQAWHENCQFFHAADSFRGQHQEGKTLTDKPHTCQQMAHGDRSNMEQDLCPDCKLQTQVQ